MRTLVFVAGLLVTVLMPGCVPQQPATVYESGGKFHVWTQAQIAADMERDRESEAQRQRDLVAQNAAIDAARQQEQRQRQEARARQTKADDDLGYQRMGFVDFQLDGKTMPVGSKVSVSGFYRSNGDLETLAASFMPDSAEVVLITDGAPRDVRKNLIACRGPAPCPLTVLAHVSKCTVTFLGTQSNEAACLVVESAHAITPRTD